MTCAEFDSFTDWLVEEQDFLLARRLDDGTYVGLMPLAFTKAICIGITRTEPFARRYCYDDLRTALDEYHRLVTGDDLPSGWIARRPELPEDVAAKRRPNYDPRQFWPKREE